MKNKHWREFMLRICSHSTSCELTGTQCSNYLNVTQFAFKMCVHSFMHSELMEKGAVHGCIVEIHNRLQRIELTSPPLVQRRSASSQ